MTVSATIEASVLADALGAVSTLVDECKLRFGPEGLETRAVDPANVGMVEIELDPEAFETYTTEGELVGINLDRLTDVVGMADSDELVTLDLDPDSRKLTVSAGGLEFTLATIDPDSIREEPDIPDLDLPATYVLEAGDLSRGWTAADMVGDHVEVTAVAEDQLRVTADGDTDSVEVLLNGGDLLDGRTDETDVSSLFSLDYLSDMDAAIPSGTELSVRIGDEFPTKMQWSDGDLSVVYMLAPRIASDGGVRQ
jgi:proliferating cell nuclear antigen